MAEQNESQKAVLYAARICPFAARAWLAAEIKNVPYDFKACSLKEKEDFFKDAYSQALGRDESNAGKVPIWMTKDGRFITESAIVVRYIDHVYSDEKKHGKGLLPSDPFQRAAVEVMADWFGGCGWIRLHYQTLKECDPQKAAALVTEWKGKWKLLNQRLSQFTKEGLYLPDGRMSFFECMAYPFMERLCVIEKYAELDIFGKWMAEFPRIKSWYEAMMASEAVKTVRQDPKFLIDGYSGYRQMGVDKLAKEKAEKTKAVMKTSGIFVSGLAVGAVSAAAYFGKLKR